jgi:hypothetical protein
MDSRIPLPNSLRCPALALFRKYNYPDKALVEAFKDETTKEHLEIISKVALEIKDDGTIQEYGRSIEPEHIARRVRNANSSSGTHISGRGEDSRTEQEGKDAGTGSETSHERVAGREGGITGSEGNQQGSIICSGSGTAENNSASRGISESTEREIE